MAVGAEKLPQQLPQLQNSATTRVCGVQEGRMLYCSHECGKQHTISSSGEAAEARRITVLAPSKTNWTPALSTLSRLLRRASNNCTTNRRYAMLQCEMHMKMCSCPMRRRAVAKQQACCGLWPCRRYCCRWSASRCRVRRYWLPYHPWVAESHIASL